MFWTSAKKVTTTLEEFEIDEDDDFVAKQPSLFGLTTTTTNQATTIPISSSLGNGANGNDNENDNDMDETAAEMNSWSKLHLSTCQSMCSLIVTPQQVLENDTTQTIESPLLNQVVLWSTKQPDQKAIIDQLSKSMQSNASSSSSSSSPNSSIVWNVASTLYRSVLGPSSLSTTTTTTADLQQAGINQEIDDALLSNDENYVKWTQPMIHVGLARKCLQSIQNNISNLTVLEGVATTTTTTAATTNTTDTPSATTTTTITNNQPTNTILQQAFVDWCRTQDQNPFVSKLPQEQCNFLLEVLLQSGKATANDGLLVLLPNDTLATSTQVDAAIAKFRLQRALDTTQINRDRWIVYHDQALQKAKAYKARGLQKQALNELQRKAMIDKRIQQAEQTLLNLELTMNTLETSSAQKEIMLVLQKSSETLQQLRLNVDSEHIDQVATDLKGEMDQLEQAVQQSATASGGGGSSGGGIDIDEEELMRELQELTEMEDQAEDSSTVSYDLPIAPTGTPKAAAVAETVEKAAAPIAAP